MIVYFSGTGNSFYVAKSLLGENERLVDVMTEDGMELSDERLGIVYPCYCGDAPKRLLDFLIHSKITNAKYIFAVCTCGASAGRSFRSIQFVLNERGAELNFARKIIMPDSCVLLAFPRPMVNSLLRTQDRKIARIKTRVEKEKKSRIRPKEPFGEKSKLVWELFGTVVGIYDKSSTKKCIGCGKCEDICKAHNIKLVDGKATFINDADCYQCFACINSCPKFAIKFGKLRNNRFRQYLHPIYREKK